MRNKRQDSLYNEFDTGMEPKGICYVAAAIIGSAVVGGVVSSSASRSAANTQANAATQASNSTLQATQETNALNWNIYQQNLANESPMMQSQQMAEAALMNGLGLGTPQVNAGGGTTTQRTGGNVPGIGPGGSPGGVTGTMEVPGSNPNGTTNYGATQAQLNSAAGSQGSGSLLSNFTNADLNAQMSPSYAFELQQGEQATLAHDAALGISQSGQGMKDATNFAENTASNFYQQAFNNYQSQQQQNINTLSVLAGNGAVSGANAAGTSAGSAISQSTMAGVNASNNYLTSGANATAAGTIGQANALSGAIGNATSGYLTAQMISKMQ